MMMSMCFGLIIAFITLLPRIVFYNNSIASIATYLLSMTHCVDDCRLTSSIVTDFQNTSPIVTIFFWIHLVF